MKYSPYNRGFSLIELILYVAIFAVISIAIIHSLVLSVRMYSVAQSNRRLQNDGELVMERIIREVREADSVTIGSSTFGSHPGTLALTSSDSGGAIRTVLFSVSSGSVMLTENSGTPENLSSGDVVVSGLVFRRILGTDGQEAIKVELTLDTTRGFSAGSSFYSTVVVRGSY